MNLRPTLLALLLPVLLAAPASGIGFTDYSGRTRNQFERIRADGEEDPATAKLAKKAGKAVSAMENAKLAVSYAAELKGIAKVAKTAEKSFVDDAGLTDRLEELMALYAADIDAARTALAADAAGGDAPAAKALGKVDKALAKIVPGTPASGRLKAWAKAAKTLGARLATGTMAREAVWAISGATVAPVVDAHDFTGDAAPDNALRAVQTYLAGKGFDLDAALGDSIREFTVVALLWAWEIESFEDDPAVTFGALNGLDPDGDREDNFLGFETFLGQQAPDPVDGHPSLRGPTAFDPAGAFSVQMNGSVYEVAELLAAPEAPVFLRGTASSDSVSGVLGFAVWAETLLNWLEAKGMSAGERENVRALADLDLDNDMVPDAFSCGLAITAVTAEVTLP